MATPSEKSPEIRRLMDEMAGVDTEASIRADVCCLCGRPATVFRDALSRREFTISGLCQGCQDSTFDDDEEGDL